MSKIGIAVKLTSEGANDLDVRCGNGEWSQRIRDVRNVMGNFECSEKGKFLTFLSFDNNGCLITIMTPVPMRDGDNDSAYIYVPSALKVDGEQIKSVWEVLKSFLASKKNEDEVNKAIDKTYEDRKYPLRYKPSNPDGKNAYIQLDGLFNINDLFTAHLYHEEYTAYKHVFVLGYDDSMSLKQEENAQFTKISPDEYKKVCILLPPDKKNLHGVTVYYKKGEGQKVEFTTYLQCLEGDKVELVYERSGFQPKTETVEINQTETVEINQNEQKVQGPTGDWQKILKKSDFYVYSSEGKINSFCLVIGGNVVPESTTIPENGLSKVKVRVEAVGYEVYEKENFDLKTLPFKIPLKPKYKTIEKKVSLRNPLGEKVDGKLTYQVQDGHNEEITLPGYHTDPSKKGWLVPDEPKSVEKQKKEQEQMFKPNWCDKMTGSVAKLVLVLLLALVGYCFYALVSTDYHTTSQSQAEAGVSAKDDKAQNGSSDSCPSDSSSVEAAVRCLDNSWTWKRSEMEKYEKLKGLFDNLNSFKFSEVKKVAQGDLKGSDKLKKLVEKIGSLDDQDGEKFTSNGDIKIGEYEKKLDELRCKAGSNTKAK